MWKQILEVLGDVGLQKLTATDWHRLDDVMIGRRLSGKYRRNVRASLRKALSDAEKLGYVLRNVIALTEPPSIDDSMRREAFTIDEVRALLAVDDRLHTIWRLFFEAGARRGEITGLTDDDVDGSRIAIRRQVLVHPSRTWDQDRVYVRQATKSRRDRVVVVNDGMADELRRWKAQRARERLAFGPAYQDGGWICAEPDGSRIAPDTMSSRSAALERRAGVPLRGLHAYRHTHATLALAAGTRLDVVSRQLGHSSIAITADVYGHPDDKALEEAARRMEIGARGRSAVSDDEEMDDNEQLTVPEYVRRKIRAAGFDIDSIDDDPRQREYAVMRDVLATVKRMRSEGAIAARSRKHSVRGSELTDWAMEHPATIP